MNMFLLVFNAKGHSGEAIDALDSVVKGEFASGCVFIPVVSCLDLSVFLVSTCLDDASLRSRLDEMNDDSVRYWLSQHMPECVPIQLEGALIEARRHLGESA